MRSACSATFKCGKCQYVAEVKQDLEMHEIQHKEKSLLRCRLGSVSVEECSHLTRHMKDHHSAPQNTPAPIQEVNFIYNFFYVNFIILFFQFRQGSNQLHHLWFVQTELYCNRFVIFFLILKKSLFPILLFYLSFQISIESMMAPSEEQVCLYF